MLISISYSIYYTTNGITFISVYYTNITTSIHNNSNDHNIKQQSSMVKLHVHVTCARKVECLEFSSDTIRTKTCRQTQNCVKI